MNMQLAAVLMSQDLLLMLQAGWASSFEQISITTIARHYFYWLPKGVSGLNHGLDQPTQNSNGSYDHSGE